MRSLFLLSYILLFVGLAFPPFLIAGAVALWFAVSSLRRQRRGVVAVADAKLAKREARNAGQALRFFA